MAAVDIESVIKKGVEQALNKPILNGKSVLEWAAIGMGAPQVVRCKDCKYWRSNTQFCGRWTVSFHAHRTPPEWYCADGDVKQDADD